MNQCNYHLIAKLTWNPAEENFFIVPIQLSFNYQTNMTPRGWQALQKCFGISLHFHLHFQMKMQCYPGYSFHHQTCPPAVALLVCRPSVGEFCCIAFTPDSVLCPFNFAVFFFQNRSRLGVGLYLFPSQLLPLSPTPSWVIFLNIPV